MVEEATETAARKKVEPRPDGKNDEVDQLVWSSACPSWGSGLAIPAFRTGHTKDVARVENVKVQSTELTTHVIPPNLSVGVSPIGRL